MKFKILNFAQKGFSLVEVTIAIGLLGIAGLAVMRLSDNVSTNTVRAETTMAKAQFASALGQHLSSPLGCDEVKIPGRQYSTDPNSPTPITVTKWNLRDKAGNQVTALGPGTQFKYFNMTGLGASVDNSATLPVVNINGQPHKKSIVTIKATVTVPPNRNYDYYYHLPVLINNSNVITDCSESKNMRETCVAMRGVYDDATGKCELEKTCKLKGTYQILTCSPSGYSCNTLEGPSRVNDQTGSYSCPASSVAHHTGTKTWTSEASCGKKCTQTVTNNMRWYSCLECPAGVSGSSSPTPGGGGWGPGGGGGCFVAGTRITLANNGFKNIEDVKSGDELLDSKGKIVKVTKLVTYKHRGPIYSINGGRHFFTPNHPFLTLEGWKSLDPAKSMKESPGLKVSMLREGDVLLKQGGMETVYVLDAIYSEEDVYNFTVTDSHEYIADDYFVHNLEDQIKMAE